MPTSAFNQPPKPEIFRYLSLVLALPSENRGQIGKSQSCDKNNSEGQKLREQSEEHSVAGKILEPRVNAERGKSQ